MFYSSLYNYSRCARCAMHTQNSACAAAVEDGYMINGETGEVIDNAIIVHDSFSRFDTQVPMCEFCARAVAEKCEDDNEYHADYIYTEDTNIYYSRDYAESCLYQCEDCGNWYEYEDSLRYTGGGSYCCDCAKYHSVICGYHDHHGDYYPVGGDWCDNLIGLEIESDYYDGAETDCAEELHALFNRGREILAFEEDCSLSEGFETITHPHTLEAIRAFDFDLLCDTMQGFGACANPYTAGLHMHFSRSWFGADTEEQQATIGRLMRAYSENWDALVCLSNRGDSYSIENYANPPTIYEECSDLDIYAENRGGWGNRYRAINCENRNTIEFRLGAGFLDADYMRAWLELHVSMIQAARLGQAFRVNYDYTITILNEGRQAA